MLEILTKSLDEFTAGRWDSVKAAITDDVIYEEPTGRVVGAEAYLAVLQRWRRAFPDVKCTIVGGFASGERVVVEVEWKGTSSGPLETPFGTLPATNQRVTVKACLVCVIRDGKIREQHHYFDLFALLSQLGIAPGMPARAPAAKAEAAPPTA